MSLRPDPLRPCPADAPDPTTSGSVVARYARWDGPGRGFSLHTTSTPADPGPGRALVAVDLATVCGSDLHSVRGDRPAPWPGVLGHEQVGTAVAVHPDDPPMCSDGTPLEVGDQVVWSVTASCGSCDRCRRGLQPKCRRLRKYGHEPLDSEGWVLNGGFATHVELLPGTTIVRMPPEVPDTVAAPASCATATVAAALTAAGSPGRADGELAGRRVLITGAGMLGVTAAAMAAAAGAEVVVSDPDPQRRDQAVAFGAHHIHDPDHDPAVRGIDAAIELSGSADAVSSCLAALEVGGTAVLAGTVSTTRPVPVDPEHVIRGLLTIVGVHNYRPADLDRAVAFLAAHHRAHPFSGLVADRYTLDTVADAVDALGTGAVRPGLRPSAPADPARPG